MVKKLKISCPTCQKNTSYNPKNTYRPFCSERCKLIDLGAWAAEEHVIKTPALTDDLIDEDMFNLPPELTPH